MNLKIETPGTRRLKDRISMTGCHDAIQAAFTQVSAIQLLTPAVQVTGSALLFSVMCEAAGLDVSETLNQVQRMKADAMEADASMVELSALRQYVREEVGK